MFKHTQGNMIHIANTVMPLDEFLDLEPEYMLPEGALSMYYDPPNKFFMVYEGSGMQKLPPEWGYGDYIIQRKNEFAEYHKQVEEIHNPSG